MEIDEKAIVEACLKRWKKTDYRTIYFSKIYSNWINQIPVTTSATVFRFLYEFCYYPHEVVNGLLAQLHRVLLENETVKIENTIYTVIKSKTGIVNSSNDYLIDYMYANGLSKYTCFSDMAEITDKQWSYIKNVVFIDDCSGSGKTFLDFIDSQLNLFFEKNIYFITIHIMEEAVGKINEFAKDRKIHIEPIYHNVQKKAFNDFFFANSPEMKTDFIQTSNSLGIPVREILGYSESESLCAFYNNTPNNTLGIFRYNTTKNQSPFPRKDDKKPTWYRFFRDKKMRGKQNLDSRKERNKYV